jgi:hypothetical protein
MDRTATPHPCHSPGSSAAQSASPVCGRGNFRRIPPRPWPETECPGSTGEVTAVAGRPGHPRSAGARTMQYVIELAPVIGGALRHPTFRSQADSKGLYAPTEKSPGGDDGMAQGSLRLSRPGFPQQFATTRRLRVVAPRWAVAMERERNSGCITASGYIPAGALLSERGAACTCQAVSGPFPPDGLHSGEGR